MRIRFREHELTLVSLLAAMLTGSFLLAAWNQPTDAIEDGYFSQVLLPQMLRILLPYLSYLLINFRLITL